MKLDGRTTLVCNCRGTMTLDGVALARACGAAGGTMGGDAAAFELCGADIARFTQAAGPVLVACTQEAPAFRQAHAEAGRADALDFVNIREAAGWSAEAAQALPKMAALLAAAAHRPAAMPPTEVSLQSEGVTVIYGTDETAIAAAAQLKDRLDLTVIITGTAALTPPRIDEFPVVRGTITRVTGHLGAFDLVVDGYAPPLPSSRAVLEFMPPRNGAKSRCDVIIDLTDGLPLVTGHEHREGYLRAAPGDPVAVQRVLFAASDLVGSFSKPRYVTLHADRCAHARSEKIGCTRCLDACPAGAISPAGDAVAIDPHICAGCGQCVAVCPTTAVEYAQPGAQTVARGLRTLLATYAQAGGTDAVLLMHDDSHGAPLIDALARHGDGLPARVIPVPLAGQPGLDAFATALAFGAADIRVLVGGRDQARRDAIGREVALMAALTEPLGYGAGRLAMIDTDDPFALGAALAALPRRAGIPPARYLPTGDKTALTMQALGVLHDAAPTPQDAVALPPGAPIGRVVVDVPGCTLCLACVSACPTSALRDNDERPMLQFVEDACVQCGLCASTCPEHVITLEPRATFGPARRVAAVIKEEAPAICIRCAKPFGAQSSIERVARQLEGKHWMFTDPAFADRIRMCADCRVEAQTQRGIDPYAGPPRPAIKTVDDYR